METQVTFDLCYHRFLLLALLGLPLLLLLLLGYGGQLLCPSLLLRAGGREEAVQEVHGVEEGLRVQVHVQRGEVHLKSGEGGAEQGSNSGNVSMLQ